MSWYINVKAAQKVKAEQEAAAKKAQTQQQTSSVQTQNVNTNIKPVAQNKPTVSYKRTPTGIDYTDKTLTVETSQGPAIKETLTKEQQSNIQQELAKVNAAPSTNEEALAKGASSYIPEADKQKYRNELESSLNAPSKIVTLKVTPKQTNVTGSQPLNNDLFSGSRTTLGFNIGGAPAKPILDTKEKKEVALSVLTLAAGLPILGPVAVAKEAAIGVGASQAIKTGATAYYGGDITQSLLTPKELLESASFGVATGALAPTVISGAVKLRAYGITKIEPVAESALARSTRLVESSVLGKQATSVIKYDTVKFGKLLDVKEAQLATGISQKVVNPVKYSGTLNKAVGGVGSVKSKVVTLGQRGADVIMPQGQTEASAFMRGVVKPNLANYSKVGKTTFSLYGEKISGELGIVKSVKYPKSFEDFELASILKAEKALTEKSAVQSVSSRAAKLPSKTLENTKSLMGNARGIVQKNALADPVESLNSKAASKLAKQIFEQPVKKQGKSAISLSSKKVAKTVDRGFYSEIQTKAVPSLAINGKDVSLPKIALKNPLRGKAKGAVKITKPKATVSTQNLSDFEALMKASKSFKKAGVKAKTINQLEPFKVSVGDVAKPVGRVEKDFKLAKGLNAVAIQTEKTAAKSNVISMPKAARLPYPGTALQMREEEETTYLSYPKNAFQLDKAQLSSVLTKPTGITVQTPKIPQKPKIRIDTSIGPITKPIHTPINIPNITQKPIVKEMPSFKLPEATIQVPKITMPTAIKPRYAQRPFVPSFGVGGGDLGGGGNATLRGKWRKVNNPVKTADAMLSSFGIKTSKGTKKALRRIERFDKRVADVGFKKAVSRKKRGRGRR